MVFGHFENNLFFYCCARKQCFNCFYTSGSGFPKHVFWGVFINYLSFLTIFKSVPILGSPNIRFYYIYIYNIYSGGTCDRVPLQGR